MFIKIVTLVFTLTTLIFANPTLEVVKKVTSTVKISVTSNLEDKTLQELDEELLYMIKADLKIVGIYKIVEDPAVQLDYMIEYKLSKDEENYRVDFMVKDNTGSIFFNRYYIFSKKDRYPFLSHRFTVDISKKFGVRDLEWMERLVVFSSLVKSGETEISISDYSLTFKKTIIKNGISMFPKWADKEQNSIYYTKFEDNLVLYKYNIITGKRTKILEGTGMLVCSDVSEDGNRLLVTQARDGQPDIYEVDLEKKTKRRVTNYKGIDVNANFIEDENSYVFVSDRFGYPEIFKGDLRSGTVEQLVFKGKNNNYVDAYKESVIFVSRDTNSEFGRNTFNVYLISTKTDYIRQLTSTGQNFFPRFSDDGNTILYIKRYKSESALGVIRLNQNKSFLFPLDGGKIQSIDW